MFRFITVLMLICIFSMNLSAQVDVKISKKTFIIKEEGFKEAYKAVKMGNAIFVKGKSFYYKALPHYLEAAKYNGDDAALNYKIGVCYLYASKKENALDYLKKSVARNSTIAADINLMLARAYQHQNQFDSALVFLGKFQNDTKASELTTQKLLANKIEEECKAGKELIKKPLRVYIDNLGAAINTDFPEYNPLIDSKDSILVYTSMRENTTGEKINPASGQYFEDIYISENGANGWKYSSNKMMNLNTKENDAAVGLSSNGKLLVLYKGNVGSGDLFYCTLKKDKSWSSLNNFGKFVNGKKSHESSASFMPNDSILYFVSNRNEDSFGGYDIFVSRMDKKGNWLKAQNAGQYINTQFDERSVFIHPDGKTMYFSSQGHNSMGGSDLFMSTWSDSLKIWNKPLNLGFPVNTTSDETFIVISNDKLSGYFASVRSEGYGEKDIYKVYFLGEEKPSYQSEEFEPLACFFRPVNELKAEPAIESTVLQGKITNSKTTEGVEANIEIIDKEANVVLHSTKSNKESGEYLIALPGGKNFSISIIAENYMMFSDNISVEKSVQFQTIKRDYSLDPIEIGTKLILKNIYFDTGKSTLRSESGAELENLIKFMTDYPNIKIEISGHTDNKGNATANQTLSKNRAKAVVDYAISKGIPKDRLTYEGYGAKQPVADNKTEEGRQLNRRVEAKVTGN